MTRVAAPADAWRYECPLCYESYQPDELPEDGRCHRCDASPMLCHKESEFGAGLVVSLAKFSEHLWTDREGAITDLGALKSGRRKRDDLGSAATSTLKFAEDWWQSHPQYRKTASPLDAAIAEAIELWANGASDHFADLDDERAPTPLKELAELMWRLRNGHLQDEPVPPTVEDFKRVRVLWRESAMALDRMLGTKPNWGEN